KPTAAGRTLDVSASGEAGIDWANIGTPTTAQNLSATTISTTQAVASATSVTNPVTLTTGERTAVGVAVRDTNNTAPASNSLGADIKAGVATDPWTTILPGAYAANSAGKLIGDNLDAKV